MRFNCATVETKNGELEEGKTYLYKESLPSCFLLFRLDKITVGHPEYGEDWIEIKVTILKSLPDGMTDKARTTWSFRNNEHGCYGGMWRILDKDAYIID